MTDFLYRFRSVDNLLGEYQELENQEIYFAAPTELNDPMEGYKNIFWSGDEIIWKNLLKHYILCLEHVYRTAIIGGEAYELSRNDIPVFKTEDDFATEDSRSLYLEAERKFFKNSRIVKYPEWLSQRSEPICENELYLYLKHLHFYAMQCILKVYLEHGLIKNLGDEISSIVQDKILDHIFFEHMNQMSKGGHENAVNRITASQRLMYSQIELIHKYNGLYFSNEHNRQFLLLAFPEQYLRELEKIAYPRWYAACFLQNYKNSATWGYYADGHKGACLQFKVQKTENRPSIALRGIRDRGKSGSLYRDIASPFYKISYEQKYPEIDFFRSFGQLPMPSLAKWYFDKNRKRSICAEDLYEEEDKWRKKYWEQFYECITTKLSDWSSEDEYRLLLSSQFINYEEKSTRKLKYKFEDLESITFGIKTPEQDKLKIIKIIEEKCKTENRKNFKFFQAFYNDETGKIDRAELSLLKFQQSVQKSEK